MERINYFITNFCLTYQKEIIEYLGKCHAYIKDLLTFKKIAIYSKLKKHTDFQKKEIIQNIISSTNSALNTIGIPIQELVPNDFIVEKTFTERIKAYSNYNEFYENELRAYANRYLFVSLIEYVIEADINKVDNLDLFDLLPAKFKDKLIEYRINNPISFEDEELLNHVLQHINHYIDLNTITVISESFNKLPQKQIPSSEENIIDQLEKAKESALNLIQYPNEVKAEDEYLNKDLEDLKGAIIELSGDGKTFAHYFGNFPQMTQKMITLLTFNRENLFNCIKNNPESLDIENLFYIIAIAKMIGFDLPLHPSQIIEYLKPYISARVFSSGIYHKPNPISNAYGLSILSELNFIDSTDIIDLLDIEMFLENEFTIFIPEKLLLNFYALVALKMLEKRGNIITDKNDLLKELVSLDVTTFSDKNVPFDMMCHLASIKLIEETRDVTRLKQTYYSELTKALKQNGSINNNLTDTARALLVLDLIELDQSNEDLSRILIAFIKRNNRFFDDSYSNSAFHWSNDPLAFKVELRMLFWVCLALSFYENMV